MFIEDIQVDGFKSYSTRQDIGPFDKQFNAITGLNGSGKSNILDSICFVLGITNLEQVRVKHLNELVYKQGQAGVTKASVTVVFNNMDKSQSPVGYEKHDKIVITRQIVIGGRNRYLLNGLNAQHSQIANMFHSVSLNVNQPHFLIMQGRITKVINMKPNETLNMIEEAAGTRMYEVKRTQSQKILEKKESKMQEIERVVREELIPTIEKLKTDKTNYMQWSANINEIEKLNRVLVALDYCNWVDRIQCRGEQGTELEEELTKVEKQKGEAIAAIDALNEELEVLSKKKNSLSLSEAQVRHTDATKEVNTAEMAVKSKKKEIDQLVKKQKKMEVKAKEMEASYEKAETVLAAVQGDKAKSDKEMAEIVEGLEDANMQLQQLAAGIQAESGKNSAQTSLQEKYQQLDADLVETDNFEAQHKQHVTAQFVDKLRARERELKEQDRDGERREELRIVQEKMQSLQREMEESGYNEAEWYELKEKKDNLYRRKGEIQNKMYELEHMLAKVNYTKNKDYDCNHPRFDERKIRGCVAKLFLVEEEHIDFMTALEIVAGGKLYNVVVEDEQTGKLLVDGGSKRRVTFMPLNKIEPKRLNHQVKNNARKLADNVGGIAYPAIEIIGYKEEIEEAMQFVFGRSFVCDVSHTAKEIAFNPNVKVKCVTKEGDAFDPAGTLTGGSKPANGDLLMKIKHYNTLDKDLKTLYEEMEKVSALLETMNEKWQLYQELWNMWKQKERNASLLQLALERSDCAFLAQDVESMRSKYEAAKVFLKDLPLLRKKLIQEKDTIAEKIANFDNTRETMQKELKSKIVELTKKQKALVTDVRKSEDKYDAAQVELESLKQKFDEHSNEFNNLTKEIDDLKTNVLSSLEREFEVSKGRLEEITQELIDMKEQLKQSDQEAEEILKQVKKQEKLKDDTDVQVKKLKYKLQQFNQDGVEARERVKALLKEHRWIEKEQSFFGKAGTDFDFKQIIGLDIHEQHQSSSSSSSGTQNEKTNRKQYGFSEEIRKLSKQLDEKKDKQKDLNKIVNKKVMTMFDKTVREYDEVMRRKAIVQADKDKILQVIENLDKKKLLTVRATWQEVDRNFNAIFSTLLQGTSAKLEPPEGMTETEGLEIRVAFNNVWKQSLSELSGGQRSLLALSLILALLRYKPAPMYILDEIDSALDLSHTQNIGYMIKQHFPNSQFIVVSLKEGMFNHANVLFKTRFVDGCSQVSRYTTDMIKEGAIQQDDKNADIRGKKRKRAA